ncbi:MAG: hypothetical protein HY313_05880 [Acidobacteria bacterium]|nr:hypothetical protein [Acidobacteriota bacterium]
MKNTLWATGILFLGCMTPVLGQTEEIVLPAGTQLQVVLETTLSTKDSKAGDPFRARLAYAVFANEQEVLPIGTLIEGKVVNLKGPGRVAGKPEMQLRPEKLILPGGDSVLLSASVTDAQTGGNLKVDPEEGTIKGSGKEGMDTRGVATTSATAAVIGAIYGGGEGALIGAGAVGAIALLHQIFKRGKDAVIPAGSELMLELSRPVSYTPLKDEAPVPQRNRGRDPDARPRLSYEESSGNQ